METLTRFVCHSRRRVYTLGLSICICLLIFHPIQVAAQSAIVIDVQFKTLQQGTAGLIVIHKDGLTVATASAFGNTYTCFPANDGEVCLLAVPMSLKTGTYPLHLTLTNSDQSTIAWDSTVSVASGQFVVSSVILPSSKLNLLSPKLEEAENSRLLAIYSIITPERYWDGAFLPPVYGVFTSSFGSMRTYNDGVARQHTGADLQAQSGTPVLASANGLVVFAHRLDIHGNTVIIDHGWGVYTAYSHLSAIFVVPGQFVLQGDLVGLVGTTGRSTGPHLHWEAAVDDVWVNPVLFTQLKIPT